MLFAAGMKPGIGTKRTFRDCGETPLLGAKTLTKRCSLIAIYADTP